MLDHRILQVNDHQPGREARLPKVVVPKNDQLVRAILALTKGEASIKGNKCAKMEQGERSPSLTPFISRTYFSSALLNGSALSKGICLENRFSCPGARQFDFFADSSQRRLVFGELLEPIGVTMAVRMRGLFGT
jgi:hypothetical protein